MVKFFFKSYVFRKGLKLLHGVWSVVEPQFLLQLNVTPYLRRGYKCSEPVFFFLILILIVYIQNYIISFYIFQSHCQLWDCGGERFCQYFGTIYLLYEGETKVNGIVLWRAVLPRYAFLPVYVVHRLSKLSTLCGFCLARSHLDALYCFDKEV